MTAPALHQASANADVQQSVLSTEASLQQQQQTGLASGGKAVNQKRHLRERHVTNYNEDFIQFDNLELDERPFKQARTEHATTVPSISASHLELETAWAVVVNAGESILDEEEDLLPAGAHEQVYVQVKHVSKHMLGVT